jgi:hypothetical protein
MLGRTCFITSLAFGVVTNSQIVFWPSRGEIITDHFLSQGDARNEVIIPSMGSMVTLFLAPFCRFIYTFPRALFPSSKPGSQSPATEQPDFINNY